MKTPRLPVCGSVAWLAVVAVACSANIHDNTITIPNAMVNFTTDVDVDNVAPDETVPLVVTTQNVYLVEPSATPPAEHVADAGHLQIYLDDTSKPPLVVTAQVNVDVKIPMQTPPGAHKLICRFHKHDGTATNTKFEVNITVKVKVTVGGTDAGGGGGAPDAGNPDTSVTVVTDAGTAG